MASVRTACTSLAFAAFSEFQQPHTDTRSSYTCCAKGEGRRWCCRNCAFRPIRQTIFSNICGGQGSGKTLAYGLPILHGILSRVIQRNARKTIQALILAPTRELALQVVSHLNACIVPPSSSEHTSVHKRHPPVNVNAVVGGMAVQKQRRLIERGVDVIVATPGRLWELIEEVC